MRPKKARMCLHLSHQLVKDHPSTRWIRVCSEKRSNGRCQRSDLYGKKCCCIKAERWLVGFG